MPKATGSNKDVCPISRCAEIVSGKWTLLVIRDLSEGPKYFRDLENSLAGISPRTLCERLKFLAERGLVNRTYIKALPPRAEYELTERGMALIPILAAMREYGSQWIEVLAVTDAKPARKTATSRR